MKFHQKKFLEQLKDKLAREKEVLEKELLWLKTQSKVINEIIEECV